ncbi:protein kinase C and casein kinase substrate in neurons protein 2-like isoform X1 [Amphibalanus amphitrite]|uniref:protein kinase C and casein kinase substrate in neurons protein 2-like isoform X1 n=1 Tax=Amphibalanus amphitrite TaxID=1232801 RepID=UPI001C92B74E|nr:protein kinase C and casein kinase substrate in neurons protein 2-like isoform X1 [Amphibalanus amphitrite]XP_043211451.1 protein kinase C and casein kinase substrate in neurons protein 2-like isoform X1 [Amphibalanus amphitrite]XP_043211452.1 protein kinase C and casein kinase substrate in neurons protein 2-like isoform X1 [Amphibalanus amphitrite]XP_043211453.1 protein kinase C and casein kinase substrate in neurons protein 2-like isoform X1 [Amphibalanus amphitrite]XP_043211454.1 protein 
MSVNSEENAFAPGSDSFWEPHNYKRTCKRIEDGHKLCDDMMKLIVERGEIEKSYAKSLKAWSKKWNELIEKGPEYGTAEAAWKSVLVEADQRCELHLKVRDNLMNDVHTKVKQWQKDNFHKTMIHFKEKKEFDDAFRKAQKPWAKLLVKVNKAKAEYHAACKAERTAQNQKQNASSDPSLSGDALKKLADRVQKAGEEVAKTKERYDNALKDISDQNSKYIEDMTYVFNKCQEREGERLTFFKETLFGVHKCLNIASDPMLAQIYREFEHTIANADKEKDLRWWSNNHGVNMPMNWPAFEDYSEEFRDIAGRSRRAGRPADADGTITLINQRLVTDDLPEYDADAKPGSRKRTPAAQPGGAAAGHSSGQQSNNVSPNRSSQHSNGHGYEDGGHEEWDEYTVELVDNGEPGVPVRALYDYDGVEADELSFKAGEAFEKLEDEDEQGWCKGRKDGKVGLYPANYVQPV